MSISAWHLRDGKAQKQAPKFSPGRYSKRPPGDPEIFLQALRDGDKFQDARRKSGLSQWMADKIKRENPEAARLAELNRVWSGRPKEYTYG